MAISKEAKHLECRGRFRSDIIAGTSGLAMISLQKEDSLLISEYNGELKRFLRCNGGGIWIKIHLNPNLQLYLANHFLIESSIGPDVTR
jgi:hypothetical protein